MWYTKFKCYLKNEVKIAYFLQPSPGNIMHTWQILSVNELAHNVGCLGKYLLFCQFMFFNGVETSLEAAWMVVFEK